MKEKAIDEIREALQTITKYCPCYMQRCIDPYYIGIENGLVLRNSSGRFITSGTNNVAEKLYEIGKKNHPFTKKQQKQLQNS